MSAAKKIGDRIPGLPVKSFFVKMLTRDIDLSDAILDLLDNCVDGILRQPGLDPTALRPYEGFSADISFDQDEFAIHDNCGGIPWERHEYAFRMGRPEDAPPQLGGAVGNYGIGMKRAVFKMGSNCLIQTKAGEHSYDVRFSRKWMDDPRNWDIETEQGSRSRDGDGTSVVVRDLHPDIADRFGADQKAFTEELTEDLARHYAFIMSKGFEVRVSGVPVKPKATQLVFGDVGIGGSAVRPYIYERNVDGVSIRLAVGFTGPPMSDEEIAREQDQRRKSMDAGWTVVCNDRAVVYCDRTELTGWGEARVPHYHTQFIAISGVVEFSCDDPSKLPTTTTKHGIDASSALYLQTKNRMREGMKLFTDYTNKWKKDLEEARKQVGSGKRLSFDEVKEASTELDFAQSRTESGARFYAPKLPMPVRETMTTRQVRFTRDIQDIQRVGEYILGNADASPNDVGEACFDAMSMKANE
jgi:hypothetical protein